MAYVSSRRGAMSGRGVGDACPSMSQLMGITDCSDPCQVNQGACAAAVPGIPALSVGTPGLNLSTLGLPAGLAPGTTAPGATAAPNYTPIILAGLAVIAGIAVIKGLQ